MFLDCFIEDFFLETHGYEILGENKECRFLMNASAAIMD